MHNFELTHSRFDPTYCLAPGLFRSLQKGEKTQLDIVYEFSANKRFEFNGPELLGAVDLRVLQGLIALAGPSSKDLPPEPSTTTGKNLRAALALTEGALEMNALVVKLSYGALAREVGYANARDTKPIRRSIERLAQVSVCASDGQKKQGYRLIACDISSGSLHVALSPGISQAITNRGRHARIELGEVRGLKSDPARLVHHRLCGWIDQGKSQKVSLDTLCSYVRPDEASPQTQKKRRQTLRNIFPELFAVGWKMREYAKDRFEILRPSCVRGELSTSCL